MIIISNILGFFKINLIKKEIKIGFLIILKIKALGKSISP
jgi:hypothetical protein